MSCTAGGTSSWTKRTHFARSVWGKRVPKSQDEFDGLQRDSAVHSPRVESVLDTVILSRRSHCSANTRSSSIAGA